MASVKADKPVGTQPFGQAKKEPAVKNSDGAYKGPASRQPPRRLPQRPLLNLRRSAKGGKSAANNIMPKDKWHCVCIKLRSHIC
ncbi:unnamed protein product [Camellia sinensis]